MSRWRSEEHKYTCAFDCREGGCPGHTLQLEFCRSSDTYVVLIDDKPAFHASEEIMQALFAAYQEPGK